MPNPRRNSALWAAAALALAAGPACAQQAMPAVAPAKVAASTAAAAVPTGPSEPKTISEVYNAVGVRDAFISLMSAGGAVAAVSDTEEVVKPNIHNLLLRGVLGRLAMIEDGSTGARFLVKADGKLYDSKGKAVPGVSGSIKSATSVLLTTAADGDVQWLKLGEQTSK